MLATLTSTLALPVHNTSACSQPGSLRGYQAIHNPLSRPPQLGLINPIGWVVILPGVHQLAGYGGDKLAILVCGYLVWVSTGDAPLWQPSVAASGAEEAGRGEVGCQSESE